ncbi:hypothetical protein [Pseudomonas sp. SM4]|uniref:hypothetical protein n=1 Tax=Pseudomonas sp. SM4 TaxID=3424177 RepID=UPI003F7986D3
MNDELNVATKYGLFWASSSMEGADGELLADGTYIQLPERFSETFFVLFDKLHQLNDYCFHQLLTVEKRCAELTEQRVSIIASGRRAEELDWLDDEVPRWEDNLAVVTQATSLVLLSSFVEWGLKRVVKSLHGSVPRKPSGAATSDVEFLLQHIAQSGLHFSLNPVLLETVNDFRHVRNAFAHGDWARVDEQLANISLLACFQAVSQIFVCLESAAWEGPWKNTGV